MRLDRSGNVNLVAHADWGKDPKKRWITIAKRQTNGNFIVQTPRQVEDSSRMLTKLKSRAGIHGCVLVGFDFPIGLPLAFAERVGAKKFLELLPKLGHGEWKYFYDVAVKPEQISLKRPFYPYRQGGTSQSQLIKRLGIDSINQLRRRCELPHTWRRAACPLFWTMGGQQVGKAAISGWKEVIVPGMRSKELDLKIWPFYGYLNDLLKDNCLVVVETYPAEAYLPIGINFKTISPKMKGGKQNQASRAVNAQILLIYAYNNHIELEQDLEAKVRDGFGSGKNAEDAFDSFVGLLWMIYWLNCGEFPEPDDENIRNIEGWIFGQSIINER